MGIRDLGLGIGCECGKPGCRECAETAALAKLVREEFEQTQNQARVPTPEIVWWRAQMRAREEAERAAARPILLSQALAIAALIGLLVSVAGRLTLPAIFWSETAPAAGTALPVLTIAIVAACCLLIAPVAVYFALSRD
jgi:hypothetical protein